MNPLSSAYENCRSWSAGSKVRRHRVTSSENTPPRSRWIRSERRSRLLTCLAPNDRPPRLFCHIRVSNPRRTGTGTETSGRMDGRWSQEPEPQGSIPTTTTSRNKKPCQLFSRTLRFRRRQHFPPKDRNEKSASH